MAFTAAFVTLVVLGALLTVGEAWWDHDKFMDHPGIPASDRERALPTLRRSHVYQGGGTIVAGVVVASGSIAFGARSALVALGVGAFAEFVVAARYLLKHQRRASA